MSPRRRGSRRPILADRRGAAALEFALVVTALMLLCVGMLEYARLTWTREALQSVAIQGARCMGVQAPSCATSGVYSSSVTATFLTGQAANIGIGLTASSFTLSRSATCGNVGGFSQVSISTSFQTIVPLLLTGLGTAFPVSAQACFPNQS